MLLSAEKLTKSIGGKTLLKDVSLFVEKGDKIGVIGPNGTGKSTFLKLLAQAEESDSGKVVRYTGVRVQYLSQNPQWNESLTVLEHVFQDVPTLSEENEFEAKRILSKLGINDLDVLVGSLSGGQRKRVAIAAALIHPSDVLILDEPTNHLDTDMIGWLESFLLRFPGALIMVTHDRYFLDRVVTRIVELDRGALYVYEAKYTRYLELKAQREEAAQSAERRRHSLLRRELEWIQRGPQGRGTKSKERIARFEALSAQSGPEAADKLALGSMSARLGKKTVELLDVSFGYGERTLLRHFSYLLQREDRIGVIGNNGCGKSTLLNLIAGRLTPTTGEVTQGDTVRLGYFSQGSEDLDLSQRVIDYIKEISPTVETADGTLTASQMLEKYLFPPDLQWNTVGKLSGGERRRLYLLGILMQAPNVLLLDEPTNDLDLQSLAVLEEYLESFRGPVIVVSHDRYFLDKVTDTIFDLRGDGSVKIYLGSFSVYTTEEMAASEVPQEKKAPATAVRTANRKLKFSFKEQREFETIDDEMASLEKAIAENCAQQERHASDYVKLQELLGEKEALDKALEEKMDRWLYLTELAEKIASGDNEGA